MKKKKGIIFAIVAAVVVLAGAAVIFMLKSGENNNDYSYRSISVEKKEGEILVLRENEDELDAYEGMKLKNGDAVSVLKDGRMALKADDDKYLLAEENTNFTLEADDSGKKIVINLEEGSVLVRIENALEEDEVYEVHTPNSVMAVRGTVFSIGMSRNESGELETKLLVFDGKVESACVVDGEKKESVAVEAGLKLVVKGEDDAVEFAKDPVTGDIIEEITKEDISIVVADELLEFILDGENIEFDKDELEDIVEDAVTTVVEPETTTVEPETTTVEPETTTAEPETTTAEPETTTAEPETTTAEPETTTAEPETTTAEPETTTAEPETTTAEPETTTAEPETTTAESEKPGHDKPGKDKDKHGEEGPKPGKEEPTAPSKDAEQSGDAVRKLIEDMIIGTYEGVSREGIPVSAAVSRDAGGTLSLTVNVAGIIRTVSALDVEMSMDGYGISCTREMIPGTGTNETLRISFGENILENGIKNAEVEYSVTGFMPMSYSATVTKK